jgi:hypothetical protein
MLDPDQNAAVSPHVNRLLTLSLVGCGAIWCPCVVFFSKNQQRLHNLQTRGAPLAGGGETYNSNCYVYGALGFTGYGWAMQVCRNVNKIHMRIYSL